MRIAASKVVTVVFALLATWPAAAELLPMDRLDLTNKTNEFVMGRCAGLYVAMIKIGKGT